MSRPTIEQLRGLGDFQTLYRWNLELSSPPSAIAAPPTEDLNLRCETTELPKMSNQSIPINIRGHRIKQPGIGEYTGTLTLTFTETVNNTIKTFLKNWREAIWSTETGVWLGDINSLKAEIKIIQLNSQDNGVWEYLLVGCYLEDYDLGQLTGDGSDIQRPSMTVSYDYYKDKAL